MPKEKSKGANRWRKRKNNRRKPKEKSNGEVERRMPKEKFK